MFADLFARVVARAASAGRRPFHPAVCRVRSKRRRLAIAALFAASLGSTAAAAESSAPTILVVGDSISAEYGLPRDSGWVHLLDARLQEQRRRFRVVNASISGETTSGGRARIDELLSRTTPRIVIVELGGNDALRGLSLQTMQDNLTTIVDHAKKAHAQVLLVGMQIPPNYGKAFADRFAAVYTTVAKRFDVGLVPFFFAGFAERFELFQADRIHPTVEAQRLLLDNVWPDLVPLLDKR